MDFFFLAFSSSCKLRLRAAPPSRWGRTAFDETWLRCSSPDGPARPCDGHAHCGSRLCRAAGAPDVRRGAQRRGEAACILRGDYGDSGGESTGTGALPALSSDMSDSHLKPVRLFIVGVVTVRGLASPAPYAPPLDAHALTLSPPRTGRLCCCLSRELCGDTVHRCGHCGHVLGMASGGCCCCCC